MIQVFAKDLSEAQNMVQHFNQTGLMAQIIEIYCQINGKEYNYKILVGN